MTDNITQFSDSNFETEAISSDIPVLVDFWAEWCGPCLAVSPLVEEIADEYRGRIKVGKLNVDHNPGTAMKYGVRSIPSLLVLKGGTVSEQIVGAVPKQNITRMLDRVLEER